MRECRGSITVVPRPAQMAWQTVYSVLYMALHASKTRSCSNRSGTEEEDEEATVKNPLQCAGYLLPLWEKCTPAASWFIGLAQEGRHYGHDAGPFLRSGLFLVVLAWANPEGCTDALRKQHTNEKQCSDSFCKKDIYCSLLVLLKHEDMRD